MALGAGVLINNLMGNNNTALEADAYVDGTAYSNITALAILLLLLPVIK